MSILLKCAACGHKVPFQDTDVETEAICPGCEVLLRRRSISDEIAIPVSMALPANFEPADLHAVPKPMGLLFNRAYRSSEKAVERSVQAEGEGGGGQLALVRAVERLALAIESSGIAGHEGEVLSVYKELMGDDDIVPLPIREELKSGDSQPTPDGTVPVLQERVSSNGKTTLVSSDNRALPMNTPVLVRQEEAAVAHHFKRENQGATSGQVQAKSPLSEWVANHPVAMMITGLSLLIALVAVTTLLMEGWFSDSDAKESERVTTSSFTFDKNAEYGRAKEEAIAFLAAGNLAEATPHIYLATEFEDQLEAYYEPIANPEKFNLEFKGRDSVGKRSVYFFQVSSGPQILPLVVLQRGEDYRVFWQFGAGVGDVSWQEFLADEPPSPVLMRAFLRPDTVYEAAHPPAAWSSWLAEDWTGQHTVRVFCRRHSTDERRLVAAFKEYPVLRKKEKWMMAQVRLKHTGSSSGVGSGLEETAEIVEVTSGSWLPAEFVDGSGFYSERDRMGGAP